MCRQVVTLICFLIVLGPAAALEATASGAEGGTVVVGQETVAARWPRLGVLAYAAGGLTLLEHVTAAVDHAETWNVGSLRISPRLRDDLAVLSEPLARAPNMLVWVTVPARELDLDASACVDYAQAMIEAMGRKPDYIEPINEGYTASAFGDDHAAWITFHKTFFAKATEQGLDVPMITSSAGSSTLPSALLGLLPQAVDVHNYIGPRQPNKHVHVNPSGIHLLIGAWNSKPHTATSVTELSGRRWRVSAYADNREGRLIVRVGERVIFECNGAEVGDTPWVGGTFKVSARGKCRVTCEGGLWKSVSVSNRKTAFRWLRGGAWIDEAIATHNPAAHVGRWRDGRWAVPTWSESPVPMAVIVGEGGYPTWGACQNGLAAGMLMIGEYMNYLPYDVEAVHWHNGLPTEQTPIGVAFQWLAVLTKGGAPLRVTVDGGGLYALASPAGVLLLNTRAERTVLVEGVTPARGNVRRMFPIAGRHVKGDLSAAWTMNDVNVDEAPVRVREDGTVEVPMCQGIALLETTPK